MLKRFCRFLRFFPMLLLLLLFHGSISWFFLAYFRMVFSFDYAHVIASLSLSFVFLFVFSVLVLAQIFAYGRRRTMIGPILSFFFLYSHGWFTLQFFFATIFLWVKRNFRYLCDTSGFRFNLFLLLFCVELINKFCFHVLFCFVCFIYVILAAP